MGARDNIRSTRSRDEIDFDDEARRRVGELRVQMLGSFVPETYRSVVEELGRLALDPRTPRRTRIQALQAYTRAAGQLVAEKPTFNIDNRTGVFTMQDFLSVAQAGDTTGGGVGLPGASDTIGLPNGGASEVVEGGLSDPRPCQPEVPTPPASTTDREDGPASRVSSPDALRQPPALLSPENAEEVPEAGTRARAEHDARHRVAPAPAATPRCKDCGTQLDEEPHDCYLAGLI